MNGVELTEAETAFVIDLAKRVGKSASAFLADIMARGNQYHSDPYDAKYCRTITEDNFFTQLCLRAKLGHRAELEGLSNCKRLRTVDVSGNAKLESIDARGCLQLESLRIDECPRLHSIDIRGAVHCCVDSQLSGVHGPIVVRCTDIVAGHLQDLHRPDLFTIESEPASGGELHRYVLAYGFLEADGDDNYVGWIEHENCDLATAYAIYWRSDPNHYRQFDNAYVRTEPSTGEPEICRYHTARMSLLATIEKLVATQRFATNELSYDPLEDGNLAGWGIDVLQPANGYEHKLYVDIPDFMYLPVGSTPDVVTERQDQIQAWKANNAGSRADGFQALIDE